MSSRALGPYVGRVVVRRLPLPARPDDVGAAGDDRAGAAVVADRQVPPVRQQRLGVGAEDPADVGGVLERGVEVDVVGDLERQVQARRRPAGPGAARPASRSVSSVSRPVIHARIGLGGPRPRGHQRVERRLLEDVVHVEHLGGRDRREVEHLVADPDADPRRPRPARENTPYGRLSTSNREPAAPSTQVLIGALQQPERESGRRAAR